MSRPSSPSPGAVVWPAAAGALLLLVAAAVGPSCAGAPGAGADDGRDGGEGTEASRRTPGPGNPAPAAAGEASGAGSSAAGELAGEDLAPRGPLPPPGFMERVIRLIDAGRFDEARAMLEPVVADHPGWARAHFYLALSYHKQHRYEQARGLFERTLQLDPAYEPPRLFFGWCLYYLGELERSREMFESFLAARPDYPDAIFALGLLDFDADAVDSARARFEQAAALAAADGDASTEAKSRARLADVHLRTGDLAAARGELERSLELNPDNYETWFKLSRVLQRTGDEQGAARARTRHDEVRAARRGTPRGMGQERP